MAKKWRDIRRKYSPEEEAKIAAYIEERRRKLPLAEVRRARELTQTQLAAHLNVNQSEVSKIEKRSDMYLTTLRSYIEAMGGVLELKAVFPNGEINLELLSDIER